MITILLISLAAICKALADTLDHHYDTSVFKNLPRKYWDPNVIIKSAPQVFGYPLDAWHISNSVMIISFLIAIVTGNPVDINLFGLQIHIWGGLAIVVYGLAFNLVFNTFYNKIFR